MKWIKESKLCHTCGENFDLKTNKETGEYKKTTTCYCDRLIKRLNSDIVGTRDILNKIVNNFETYVSTNGKGELQYLAKEMLKKMLRAKRRIDFKNEHDNQIRWASGERSSQMAGAGVGGIRFSPSYDPSDPERGEPRDWLIDDYGSDEDAWED